MSKVPADKTFFNFSAGLNTEANPLAWPEGASFDEENFKLLIDGSRKRRNPLKVEVDGEEYTFLREVVSGRDAVSSYTWRDAGGDPDRAIIVIQVGLTLHFFENNPKLSTNKFGPEIELANFLPVDSPRQLAGIRKNAVSFTSGRGELFVSHPYLEPFKIGLVKNPDDDESVFEIENIDIRVREFKDIEDGIDLLTKPNSLKESHAYNLINRGWKYGTNQRGMLEYYAEFDRYPSKNMVVWYGDVVVNPGDGGGDQNNSYTGGKWKDLGNVVRDWNPEKIEAEFFGDTSAPKGALIINPFDTSVAKTQDVQIDVVEFGYEVRGNANGPTPTDNVIWIDIDTTIPGSKVFSVGEKFTIIGTEGKYNTPDIDDGGFQKLLNFSKEAAECIEVSAVDGSGIQRLYYQWNWPELWKFSEEPFREKRLGYITIEDFYNTENGRQFYRRPRANEFFAGRMFYAGIQDDIWGDQIFFSKILRDTKDAGRCYQNNDPTDPELNYLVSDDGGTIQIPQVGDVKALASWSDALLVFATHGVWAVRGDRGGFSADGFSVAKLSDVPSYSENGVTVTDGGVMFTSPRGLYFITLNKYGEMQVQSVSERTIQTLWDDLEDSQKSKAQFYYDDYNREVHLLYSDFDVDRPTEYNVDLIYDMELGAFFKYRFPHTQQTYVLGIAMLNSVDGLTRENKTKYFIIDDSGQKLYVADYSDTSDWNDWTGDELVPYLITGYDNLNDFSRYRQAPVVHTFMRSTETGYGEFENEGTSSLFMQARWNFAKSDVSGKFGGIQQIYRRPRYFSADTPEFDNGFEVINARSKLRGRGKALQIKFTGEEGKNAHLLGWAIHYDARRRP